MCTRFKEEFNGYSPNEMKYYSNIRSEYPRTLDFGTNETRRNLMNSITLESYTLWERRLFYILTKTNPDVCAYTRPCQVLSVWYRLRLFQILHVRSLFTAKEPIVKHSHTECIFGSTNVRTNSATIYYSNPFPISLLKITAGVCSQRYLFIYSYI